MYRRALIRLSIACVAMIATFNLVSLAVAAQADKGKKPPSSSLIYNPYPPGILPDDLASEIARVRREINGIFKEALGQARALTPPVLTGQPPTLQGTGYQAVQILGKLLNFDENMSPFRNRACAFCHMPYAGFSGPIPSVNLTMIAISRIGGISGRQADSATIHVFTEIPSTQLSMKHRACSSVEISGMGARPDTCCRVPTPSRRSILRSIRRRCVARHGVHRVPAVEG